MQVRLQASLLSSLSSDVRPQSSLRLPLPPRIFNLDRAFQLMTHGKPNLSIMIKKRQRPASASSTTLYLPLWCTRRSMGCRPRSISALVGHSRPESKILNQERGPRFGSALIIRLAVWFQSSTVPPSILISPARRKHPSGSMPKVSGTSCSPWWKSFSLGKIRYTKLFLSGLGL